MRGREGNSARLVSGKAEAAGGGLVLELKSCVSLMTL